MSLRLLLLAFVSLAGVTLLLLVHRTGQSEQAVDLKAALVSSSDLALVADLDAEKSTEGLSTCLAGASSVQEQASIAFRRADQRPYISESLVLYDTEEQASNAVALAPKTLQACTYASWKIAPEQLNSPVLGDESLGFFISVDCCPVVDPVAAEKDGDLYAMFVRHGRVLSLTTVITRDTQEFNAISLIADQQLSSRLAQ